MTMYKLRPYQEDAVKAAESAFLKGKNFIVQAATGAGKSLIIAEICYRNPEPTLILQPSKELLLQNYEKMMSYGIDDVALHSASVGKREMGNYVMATIGSIYRNPEAFKHFKRVIVDECHLLNNKNLSGMYTKFLKAIGDPIVCGLTATPYRIDSKFFKNQYDEMFYTANLRVLTRLGFPTFWRGGIVYKIETAELIDQSYLSPIDYKIAQVDLSDLAPNSTGQDYTTESLECFWNDKRLRALAETIRGIDKMCNRNLIFCSSIRQATRATSMLNDGGIPTKMVTGTTPAKERAQIVADFKAGKLKHLVNVGVYTTGFDVPELDSIVLARPTMSVGLYYQMVGRGVRLDPARPSKRLTVTDLSGCVDRLGRVETIRITKIPGDFKDQVESEVGVISDVPLFTFQILKQDKKDKFRSAY